MGPVRCAAGLAAQGKDTKAARGVQDLSGGIWVIAAFLGGLLHSGQLLTGFQLLSACSTSFSERYRGSFLSQVLKCDRMIKGNKKKIHFYIYKTSQGHLFTLITPVIYLLLYYSYLPHFLCTAKCRLIRIIFKFPGVDTTKVEKNIFYKFTRECFN